MITLPKGTKDVLPAESFKWQYVEKTARDTAKVFNAKEIRTPVFEHTEVFARGVGETTDIVNKEMYTFLDKGGRSVTLKPEGTAGTVRAFVESGLYAGALPVKTFYITPCFRYERPQAGRLREFHQFGVEFFGSADAGIDAEVILLAKTFLDKLGVKDLTLYINSIGCKECRKEYHKALKEYLSANYGELCDLCKDRYEKNPMRILDCKNENCKRITENAPVITDFLCDDCKAHFGRVKDLLTAAGVEFKLNPKIVRGLDYYTKTVFEFVSESIGAQGTVCGGGRYDGLVEEFGGGKIPGVGFAVGIERLLLLLESTGVKIPESDGLALYIAPMGDAERLKAFEIVSDLRARGIVAETDYMNRGVKAQFKYADKLGAKFVGVIGSDELDRGVIKIKNMADGAETEKQFNAVAEFLEGKL
ncbi:MAG: histidine--tRNA ligase [Clostridia bacterium]|nr:histidine--tRNA ligase [Clostridia bacterium]